MTRPVNDATQELGSDAAIVSAGSGGGELNIAATFSLWNKLITESGSNLDTVSTLYHHIIIRLDGT